MRLQVEELVSNFIIAIKYHKEHLFNPKRKIIIRWVYSKYFYLLMYADTSYESGRYLPQRKLAKFSHPLSSHCPSAYNPQSVCFFLLNFHRKIIVRRRELTASKNFHFWTLVKFRKKISNEQFHFFKVKVSFEEVKKRTIDNKVFKRVYWQGVFICSFKVPILEQIHWHDSSCLSIKFKIRINSLYGQRHR